MYKRQGALIAIGVKHLKLVLRVVLLGLGLWYLMHTLTFKIVSSYFGLAGILEIVGTHVGQGLRLNDGTTATSTSSCSTVGRSVTLLLIFWESINTLES